MKLELQLVRDVSDVIQPLRNINITIVIRKTSRFSHYLKSVAVAAQSVDVGLIKKENPTDNSTDEDRWTDSPFRE